MALEVQDLKKCRKTAKMENCALSQWNRWVATDIHVDQQQLTSCHARLLWVSHSLALIGM
jgi:hypothetical protein